MGRRAVSCAARFLFFPGQGEKEGLREDDQVAGIGTVGDSQLWVHSVWSTELLRAPGRQQLCAEHPDGRQQLCAAGEEANRWTELQAPPQLG